jgi:alpha-L-rhamnosidase
VLPNLLREVWRVRSAEPAFRSVRIAPAPGPLRRIQGRVVHPAGDVEVKLTRGGRDRLQGSVTLPAGMGGVLEWGGRSFPLHERRQQIVLERVPEQ